MPIRSIPAGDVRNNLPADICETAAYEQTATKWGKLQGRSGKPAHATPSRSIPARKAGGGNTLNSREDPCDINVCAKFAKILDNAQATTHLSESRPVCS